MNKKGFIFSGMGLIIVAIILVLIFMLSSGTFDPFFERCCGL
tara:strand:+ start:464 stop:589 length:126 start_codon:yes stop_codon:yes gene_type:complete